MQQQLDNILGTLAQGTGPQVTPLAFLMLMGVSLLSSLFIAYLYVHFYSNRATGSQVHRAFPLLGISITAIFVIALAALFGQALTRRFMGAESDGTIVVTLAASGTPADPAAVTALVRKRLPRAKLESVSQTDRETVVSYNFQGSPDNALAGFQAELSAAAGPSSYNVFFNRPGAL